ncbi:hypothetical protein P9386_08105 [Caldifermentibacillus hisashii]|uniref:hypothetical protein n=1 Tax=Caldifermentibacillus hisashii TaxID=996558 RepID=UPI002E1D8406|nr:hypothetical protein [Caldifermentibacillus hisashii]
MSNTYDYEYLKGMTQKIKDIMAKAVQETNNFCKEKILTRGGRVGSGMGTLLEAIWGFNMNQLLHRDPKVDCEIAWFPDNDYNDFACVKKNELWDPTTHRGELFRIEIKSMNKDADESKGHFDEIKQNLGQFDLLVVLIWTWKTDNGIHSYPYIEDFFIGNALEVAFLRDELHIARGGYFVDSSTCPDECLSKGIPCKHHGEPLNANGNRERITGPISRKPPGSSHAANFGGLVRMLKTSNDEMRKVLRKIRAENQTAHEYISFIHKNYPFEEFNQYTSSEWKALAKSLDLKPPKNKEELVNLIRETVPDYMDKLRNLYK